MYCRQCGNKLKDGIRFCPHCGSAVEENGAEKAVEIRTQTAVEPAKQKKSKKGLVIGLVAILAMVGAGTAFGMTLSRKPDSMVESAQEAGIMNNEESKSDVEEYKASAKDSDEGSENWEPLEYQTDILTVQKVGELPVPEREEYQVGAAGILTNSGVYDWKGRKFIDYKRLGTYYVDADVLMCLKQNESLHLYNKNGELLLEEEGISVESMGYPFYLMYIDEQIQGVLSLKTRKVITDIPTNRDDLEYRCIGENFLCFDKGNYVEVYSDDGELLNKIETDNVYIGNYEKYFVIEEEKQDTIYDEEGNTLFSYNREYEGGKLSLKSAGDGYFCFSVDKKDSEGNTQYIYCLVDENGNVLKEMEEEYHFFSLGSNGLGENSGKRKTYFHGDDFGIRYYYDENGIYYVADEHSSEFVGDATNCHYGIRCYQLDGDKYKIQYLNSDSVVEVEDVNGTADVFYSKDGKLYSFVDGSVALDGDYEHYAFAYGFIYAKRRDGAYDIFEIEEYNPPYNYHPMTSGEILGNIADAPEVYLFGEEAAATEEIVYEEYASESDVWWCLQNFVDNTNKTSLHYIATGTDTKFDLVWDEDAGHWRLTTTKDGVTTSQLYDDDIIYPIDGTEEAMSGSTVLDENFDTGNYYANEILGDVLALDADEANKNGETFSFIGKDSKFQNIYWEVTYNGEFWELEVSKDDGFSLSGYFDENFYFHADE